MKKLLAVLLSVMLMVSACAFAEGMGVTVNNIQVDMGGGEVLDLSGLDLLLGYSGNETQGGAYIGLAGNGAEIIRANIAANEEKILANLTGLSDTYSISMEEIAALLQASGVDLSSLTQGGGLAGAMSQEDTMALMGIAMQAMGAVTGCMSDGGMVDIEGASYACTKIALTEDTIGAILNSVAAFVDTKPEVLASLGIPSATQFLAESGLKIGVEGELLLGEADSILDLYLTVTNASNPEGSTVELYGIMEPGAEPMIEGMAATDYTLIVAPEANGEFVEALTAFVSLNADPATGDFTAAFGGLLNPVGVDENGANQYEGVYLNVLMPAAQENGMLQISAYDDEQTFLIEITAGEDAEGMKSANAYFMVGTDAVEVSVTGKEGKAQVAFNANVQGMAYGMTADVMKYYIDDAWMPVDNGATVSIMDLVAEASSGSEMSPQMQKLITEAQAVLMNTVYGVAAANQTVAMLISGMMMG